MSNTCPTVTIERDGLQVVINLDDFDVKKHKVVSENKPKQVEEAPAKAEAPKYKIVKNGKRGAASKFVIAGESGDFLDGEYDTKEEAEAAIPTE